MRRQFAAPTAQSLAKSAAEQAAAAAKPARAAKSAVKPKQKNDPRYIAAARELRDRWLEQVNAHDGRAIAAEGKYDVARALPAPAPAAAMQVRTTTALPEAA